MQQKNREKDGEEKKKWISDRRFWRLVSQTSERLFSFRLEYKKWLWRKSKKKQYIIEMYRMGWNQLEISGILLMSPIKIRRILKEARRSLEWNIKTKRLLEDE